LLNRALAFARLRRIFPEGVFLRADSMIRSIHILGLLSLALVAGGPARADGPAVPLPDAWDAGETRSPLLDARPAVVARPVLADLLASEIPTTPFAFDAPRFIATQLAAELAAQPADAAPVATAAATSEPPPDDKPTGTIAPLIRTGVLDDVEFASALAAGLGKPAASADLRTQWTAIGEAYVASFEQPLWRVNGRWSPAARATLARLALARDDALDLSGLNLPALDEVAPASIAAQDLALTAAVVAYARQASGSRVDPQRISRLITARPKVLDAREILAAVLPAGDEAGKVLEDFNPPHAAYRALRDKLAELHRAAPAVARERIPPGPPLRVGMRDARVKLVRARFGLGLDEPESPDAVVYDTRVADAVAGFQRANGLPASGILTARTVALLSGGEPGRLENEIVANMERWRWLPRDLGHDRIEVNIPNYTVAVLRDGKVTHRARVIVGKPTNPTPVFSNTMKFAVVNPSWYIPPSILKKEILPKLAADPTYLQRLGYEMTMRRGQVSVRQPPGERNALGNIKFMFPNEHAVYLHDTPSRSLFASARRAFSHGCVRVDDPMAFAESVLGGSWTAGRVKSLVGRGERTINLAEPLPIHIEYFTATVGADGRLVLSDDLYGYDGAVIRALAWKN
jgi:murein L,D-transpeptidase YcbB/YkuD